LFDKYLTLSQTEYLVYEEELVHNISVQMNVKAKERFEDMLNIFKNDIDDKTKFAQLFLENNLPFEDFYLKYMGGDYDVLVKRRDGGKVEEEPEKPRRKPLMIDEQGNVVEIPGHNLYKFKFEGPRNRLPIVSRDQFRKTIEEGDGIPSQVIEIAKIELKTNLNLSNNQIDEIINGLTQKYRRFNKFIVKLGEIILYYVNNFVIRNQENRIASLYRDRIDNNLINFRNLAYAKKVDFLPELFQFKNPDEVSVNIVHNFIERQLRIFIENFKNKLYIYITNVTTKAKNIHIGINNVVILSNVSLVRPNIGLQKADYFMFGYTDSNGENVYFDIRNKPDNLPKKLEKRLSKIYLVRVEGGFMSSDEVGEEVEEDEGINIEEIYDMFVRSLDEIDVEMPESDAEGSESDSDISNDSFIPRYDDFLNVLSDDEYTILKQRAEQGQKYKKISIPREESDEEGDGDGDSDSDSDSDYVEPEESEEETEEEEKKGGESEEEESSESEDDSLKDTIHVILRRTISDMIKNKLTVGREEKNLPPLENEEIDKLIIKNSANIEQSISDIFRDYGSNHRAIFVGENKMLEYLKRNIPDIFNDETEGGTKPKKQKTILDSDSDSESDGESKAGTKPKKQKTILDSSDSESEGGSDSYSESDGESKAGTKPKKQKTILDSDSESEGGSDSDSPDRLSKCIKCGTKASQNLKTKIKDGKEFKTVCFCSFKCFEKYKK
jgi:hypothetical protein